MSRKKTNRAPDQCTDIGKYYAERRTQREVKTQSDLEHNNRIYGTKHP